MARKSSNKDKSAFQLRREELGLSREKASELLDGIPPERIERIENGKFVPHPDEVLEMSEKYRMPSLCNYYCSNCCPIGKRYVPEIKLKDLSQIVLEMLASLNSMNKKQERLIEISADGLVEDDEIKDFVYIQEELQKISSSVEALKLWSEKMIADNAIDMEKYNKYKNN